MSTDRLQSQLAAAADETKPATGTPATPSAAAPATDPYSSWLDRVQRARGRHAAITRNLYTWSNYKSWADQVKNSWEDDSK